MCTKVYVENSEEQDRTARSRRGLIDGGNNVRFQLFIAVAKNIIVSFKPCSLVVVLM